MITSPVTHVITLRDGRQISIETGKLARQADGAAVLRMGKTMLLATVVSAQEIAENADFLPLSVDYQEKFAAAGRIPGGFLKREGRLSDYEILISRLVDRALRPLFPDGYFAETQINIYLISADTEILPDALAGLAAAAALAVSDVPFNGPVAEVRVAKIDGQLCINPIASDLERAELDIIVGGTATSIVMVEGEMNEVSEAELLEALAFAHEEIKHLCIGLQELTRKANKETKRAFTPPVEDETLRQELFERYYQRMYEVARSGIENKHSRKEAFKAIKEEYLNALPEDTSVNRELAARYFDEMQRTACRNLALDEQRRLDGRRPADIRPIWCEVDYLPAVHGSSIFTRGETQSLTTVTLGNKLDEKIIDGAIITGVDKFMLHYNFPAFSTGEIKPNRGPSRREIGHGNLAQRALKAVMPDEEQYPYVVRVVSDILESNGSSSMATVCAGSLALMDAGVPIRAAVAGIAMGLISDEKSKRFVVLSDILGDEDHLGDMDFKVAGTSKGITAVQMDIKIEELDFDVLRQALAQAQQGRLHILDIMNRVIDKPRPELKPHAPRVVSLHIDRDMIGAVIGPGGKIVQEIQRSTGATVVLEDKGTHGVVNIFAADKVAMDAAIQAVRNIVAVPEVGTVYTGVVKEILPFGAVVEFMPGKQGLLHISEIKWERIENIEKVIEPGEEIMVQLIEVDERSGKYRLSRKVLLPKPEGYQERSKKPSHKNGSSKPPRQR